MKMIGNPTTAEDMAFWAQIVLANVWLASESRWWALPFILMALALRLPYWLRAWKRGRVA
jgi:hypothetical protein